ncbi:MAG TPA: DUF2207 domain-containing protein [Clostridiaceae bacterium]|nr:DUF2207 domain-containing protein [Clostridiaceae bacterium]
MLFNTQKNRIVLLITLLLLALSTFSACSSIDDLFGRVSVDTVNTEVLVLSDGSIQLTEIFEVMAPSETWNLNLEYPTLSNGQAALKNIGIAASGINPIPVYTQLDEEVDNNVSNSPAYYVKRISDISTTVRMSTRFGRGEWLIKVEWLLQDAIVQNGSNALLSLPLLSLYSLEGPDSLHASLIFPVEITASGASIVTLSSAQIDLSQDDRVISLATTDLEPGDNLLLLFTTDASVFTSLPEDTSDLSVEQQLQEASLEAQSLLSSRNRREFVGSVIPYISLAGLILALGFYIYYELEGTLKPVEKDFSVWPTSVKPYNSSMLLNKDKPERLLLSSLLSLVNQKELWLDDYVFTWPQSGRVDFSSFRPSETYLLHWLFQDVAKDGPALSVSQIKQTSYDPVTDKNFEHSYLEFRQLVNTEHLELGLFDQNKTKFSRRLTSIFTIFFSVLAGVLTVLSQSISGLLILLPAAGFLYLRSGVRHLTKEGRYRQRECREYRKNLDNLPLLTKATDSQFTITEMAILALPRAVSLDNVNLFFEGLYKLDDADFAASAYGILHIYLREPLPGSIRITTRERERLWQRLDELRDILQSSETILASSYQGSAL